jgi:hypothetical protein
MTSILVEYQTTAFAEICNGAKSSMNDESANTCPYNLHHQAFF